MNFNNNKLASLNKRNNNNYNYNNNRNISSNRLMNDHRSTAPNNRVNAYQSRFSELETIITNAFDFARIVKALGNDVDTDQVQDLPWLSN